MEILKYFVSEVNMDVRIWGRLGVTGSLCWLWLAVIRVILTFGLLLGNSMAGRVILLRRRNHSLILSSTKTLSKADSPVGYHLPKLKVKVEIVLKSLE